MIRWQKLDQSDSSEITTLQNNFLHNGHKIVRSEKKFSVELSAILGLTWVCSQWSLFERRTFKFENSWAFLFFLFFGCFLFQPVFLLGGDTPCMIFVFFFFFFLKSFFLSFPLIFRHWSPEKTPAHKFAAATILQCRNLVCFLYSTN